jgi:hypothetical protein
LLGLLIAGAQRPLEGDAGACPAARASSGNLPDEPLRYTPGQCVQGVGDGIQREDHGIVIAAVGQRVLHRHW